MIKKITPKIKLKIIQLSKCFWYWNNFYSFYSTILGVPKSKLEVKLPKRLYNKYEATQAILEFLERKGKVQVIKEIVKNLYRLDKPFDKEDNQNYKEALIELREFKKIVGKDIIEDEIKKREFKKKLEKRKKNDLIEQEKKRSLESIKNKFYEYITAATKERKQERGYWLEKAFYELLEIEQIEHSTPYRTKDEQIDGHFKLKSFDYLVEIRWRDSQVGKNDIAVFDRKISTKGQSTRGFILSISGFAENSIQEAQRNKPRLIFMDGSEFVNILEGRNTFFDILCNKEYNLVKYGKVYK